MRLFRFLKIVRVASRYGLDQLVLEHDDSGRLLRTLNAVQFWRDLSTPRAIRLRMALEELGPIFVKFGQMLSTRRDLLPQDIADELALLQDNVPPISEALALAVVEAAYGMPADEVFAEFSRVPVASASVAQVHFATLPDGREVAVKILRPGIEPVIVHDLALLDMFAGLLETLWSDGKRLKPREVVAEFGKHLHHELDLMREASNCSQLRRNFADSPLLLVPEVHWNWCTSTVMVMDRIHGVPVSQIDALRAAGIDVSALARAGVEIFFTQVFRDGFFHADMHPGNIFVAVDASDPANKGKYIAVDFGIMGTLTESDKNYLARNFLAFFRRDYKLVAETHVESGWAPADTRVDEFEAAIRSVCEPIFDKPLGDISFGRVLLRLFQTSRQFNVEIQPQLFMLQKTLLNVEGLGRQLDPQLDLWATAKPFLERWMHEQLGWRGLVKNLRKESPHWAKLLPELPRLAHQAMSRDDNTLKMRVAELEAGQRRHQTWLVILLVIILVTVLA